MKYRKKPVVIEAHQWGRPLAPSNPDPLVEWIESGGGVARYDVNPERIVIETLEGDMSASPGDWIIRGVQGEHYPCKPDIFAATYESVPIGGAK